MKAAHTAPSQPTLGRRTLLRLAAAAGVAILAGCAADSGSQPRPALNLKRDLSKENGASKR
jgi:hypothetical protein